MSAEAAFTRALGDRCATAVLDTGFTLNRLLTTVNRFERRAEVLVTLAETAERADLP